MLKFFLRFYIGVSITLLVSLVLAVVVMENQYNLAVGQDYIRMTKAVHRILNSVLAETEPDQWGNALQQIQQDYPFHIDLVDADSLSVPQEKQLRKTGVVVKVQSGLLEDVVRVYYPTPASNRLMVLKPSKNFNHAYNTFAANLVVFVLVGFALAVMMLARPIIAHINKLVSVSRAIGNGEFLRHADEAAPSPLDKLATSINHMSSQIHKLVSEREVLTGAVSHEFRTPLTRLRFALDLADRIDDPIKLRQHVNSMTEDVEQMETLVTELLDYSRFSFHVTSLNKESISLLDLFEAVTKKLKPLSPNDHFEIKCPPELHLNACRASMLRALENLVRNAQKYGNGYIGLYGLCPREHRVSIQVVDDGEGISENERSAIVQPFYRIEDSRSKETGGVGLGLTIVNHIVALHDGELHILSNSSGGTMVEIVLPL